MTNLLFVETDPIYSLVKTYSLWLKVIDWLGCIRISQANSHGCMLADEGASIPAFNTFSISFRGTGSGLKTRILFLSVMACRNFMAGDSD